MTQDEFDRLHDCDICRECELMIGCQTDPNFGCQMDELKRRRAAPEHREPIDATTVLVCDVSCDIDSAIRAFRSRLNSESPDWLREIYAALRRIQQRLEEHGGTAT